MFIKTSPYPFIAVSVLLAQFSESLFASRVFVPEFLIELLSAFFILKSMTTQDASISLSSTLDTVFSRVQRSTFWAFGTFF